MTATISLDNLMLRASDAAGLTPEQGRVALTAALGLLDKHADSEALSGLYGVVPEAEALAKSDGARPPRGGFMGGLMKSTGGLSGKAIADAMAVLGRLETTGVGKAELKRLLPAARDQVQAATGRDWLGEVVRSVPGVGPLLGDR